LTATVGEKRGGKELKSLALKKMRSGFIFWQEKRLLSDKVATSKHLRGK